jgi:hypothetical protein
MKSHKFIKPILQLILLIITISVSGQEHTQAVGIRGGLTSGVEYRYFFDQKFAGKLLLGIRDRGLFIHGLFEVHQPGLFPFSNQMYFVYGAGIHAGYQRWDKNTMSGQIERTSTVTKIAAGIDGLIGLEYDLEILPIILGIEVKPFMDFWGQYGIEAIPWDFAFTVKLSL